MKVVVLGAAGMLGRAVVAAAAAPAAARREIDLTAWDRSRLDVTDAGAVRRAIGAERPAWVINCAAFTRVDDAEDDPANEAVNAVAPGIVAEAARAVGARVLHLSTDYVFDGALGRPYRENDAPAPLGAYGRAKLAGERAVEAAGGEWLVVRTQWLYGDGGRSFPGTMRERARRGEASVVVDDQVGAPTFVGDLAPILWGLAGAEARGVIHVTASGSASWLDVARVVYEEVTGSGSLVGRCRTADRVMRAPRPLDARLDLARVRGLLGAAPPEWEPSLRRWVRFKSK